MRIKGRKQKERIKEDVGRTYSPERKNIKVRPRKEKLERV